MSDRKTWLQKLIGSDNAAAVKAKTAEAQALLDAAGVARKQEGEQTSAVDAVAAAILTALRAAGVSIDDEARALAAIKEALTAALEAAPSQAAEEPPAMAEEMKSLVEGLSEYFLATTKDMGEMAGTQVQIAQAIKGLGQTLVPDVEQLMVRVEAMEKQLRARPRQASQDDRTVLPTESGNEAADKALAALEKKIKGGLDGKKKVLGIPVND